ncbi:hypothetical protein ACHWQZ_G011732 [Mnemiopsis leidyi]
MNFIVLSLAALCGFVQCSRLTCLNINFDEDSGDKTLGASIKNGMRMSFKFLLTYNWTSDKVAKEHYVDFNSHTGQVVLRLLFDAKCEDKNNCTQSQLQVTSIRRINGEINDKPVTVGPTDIISFSHGNLPSQVILNTTMTDARFIFTIEAKKDDGVYYETVEYTRQLSGYNYIPYQTTDLVRLQELPWTGINTSICYPDDDCLGLCMSCPPGTIIKEFEQMGGAGRMNNTHFCEECSPGSSSSSVNSAQCKECAAGSYSEHFSSARCSLCPAGTSSDEEGRVEECPKCKLGTYSAKQGALQCLTCPPGSITEALSGATTCKECQVGTFSTGETYLCQPCPADSITLQAGATECVSCSSGGRLNETHCSCSAGSHRINQTSCDGCSPGTYTPRDNMLECVECAGTVTQDNQCLCPAHMDLIGDVCVRRICTPGQKMNLDGTCSTCTPGTYSDVDDADGCQLCPPGSYQSEKGQTECLPCPSGSAQHLKGSTSCDTCKPGTYSKFEKSEQCKLCSPGSYQSEEGQTECKICPPGTSQHLKGSASCQPCQMSTYQSKAGQPKCLLCDGTVDTAQNKCLDGIFECGAVNTTFINVGVLVWPAAGNLEEVSVDCPHGGTAKMTCQDNRWTAPVLDCNSQISAKVDQFLDSYVKIQDFEAVKEAVSEDISRFGPKDVKKVAEAIVGIRPKSKEAAASKLTTALHLAKYDPGLQHVLGSPTKQKIVSIVEEGVDYLIDSGESDLEKFNTDDISLSVNSQGVLSRPLGQDQMVSITQNSSFSTVVFQNSKLFDSGNRRTELLTSRVFSVKLHGEENKVKKGFNIDLTMRVPVEGVAECRWYDTEKSLWSTEGCYVTSRAGDLLHCQCDHLTSFAAFTSLSEVPEGHKQAQSVISTLLFVLSIITLVFTLLVYLPIRSFRNRLIVQVELMEVTALILANIAFLSLAHAGHQSRVCTGLVFGVQYLYLVAISWSFVAALVFYRQIVTAIHSYGKSYNHTFKVACLLCWVLPLVFPAFAVIYSKERDIQYLAGMDGEFQCWISETWKIYTFIVPILAVVGVNTIIGIRVVAIMCRAANTNLDGKEGSWKIHKRHIKSILSLIMIFGVSFLLSLFTYGPQAVVFQYLFIVCTCSQGLFIFILFVPLRPEVHSEWKSILDSSASARLMSPRHSSRASQMTNSSLFKSSNKIFSKSSISRGRRDTVVERCVQS